ncbi:MAG: DUF86 domain-containing protein [Bacteroidaceae bacterium]|nr:DUF86 domain-containing protein [Bacteroidaceae bacterium]
MRERARDKGRLYDIVDYSNKALKMIENHPFEAFVDDMTIYFAVMKCVEIVGEATYMLSKDFKEEHPDIPWEQIQGLRHILVHGYEQIKPKLLYNTTINDLPLYRDQIESFLNNTDWKAWEGRTSSYDS